MRYFSAHSLIIQIQESLAIKNLKNFKNHLFSSFLIVKK